MTDGMNLCELQEYKAAILNAERLEVLEILRRAKDLQEAIAAIEHRRGK